MDKPHQELCLQLDALLLENKQLRKELMSFARFVSKYLRDLSPDDIIEEAKRRCPPRETAKEED